MKSIYLKVLKTCLLASTLCHSAVNYAQDSAQEKSTNIGVSQSARLITDTAHQRLFGKARLLDQLNGKELKYMSQIIRLKSEFISDAQAELRAFKDIYTLIGSHSEGNFLIGGSGKAYLREFNLRIHLTRSNFLIEPIKITEDREEVPGLRFTVEMPGFSLVQQGKVNIDKNIGLYSWDETDYFHGVFKGANWTGEFKLKKIVENVRGERRTTFVLVEKSSKFTLASRVFKGSGIPAATFLKQYGDRVEDVLQKLFSQAFTKGYAMSADDGSLVRDGIKFDRTLASITTRANVDQPNRGPAVKNILADFSVKILSENNAKSRNCYEELALVQPELTQLLPNAELNDHRLSIRSLRTSVPLSMYERALYLNGQAGKYCFSINDEHGGRIYFYPVKKISVSQAGVKDLAVNLDMAFVHERPAFFGIKLEDVTGIIRVKQRAKLVATEDANGYVQKIEFVSSNTALISSSDKAYVNVLQEALDSEPIRLVVPIPHAVGPFKPKFMQSNFSQRHLILEFNMREPKDSAHQSASRAPAAAASEEPKLHARTIDSSVDAATRAKWNSRMRPLQVNKIDSPIFSESSSQVNIGEIEIQEEE